MATGLAEKNKYATANVIGNIQIHTQRRTKSAKAVTFGNHVKNTVVDFA